MTSDQELVTLAIDVVDEVGQYLRSAFRQLGAVETKSSHVDLVTEHDRQAERMIRNRLESAIPGIRVVGEELPVTGEGPITCYVDPIDGTSNFVAGIPFYCVSIGFEIEGTLVAGVVHDPERGETFWGTRDGAWVNGEKLDATRVSTESTATVLISWPQEGVPPVGPDADTAAEVVSAFRSVRRLGSAALGLAYVAAGRADAASEVRAQRWDVAAGFLLVEAAGGVVSSPETAGSWFSGRYVAHSSGFNLEESVLGKALVS